MHSLDLYVLLCRGGRHPTQPEISVDRVSWQLQDVQHAHVVMRMLIMELVDRRVLGDFGEHVDWEVDMAVWDKIHMYNYVLRYASMDSVLLT